MLDYKRLARTQSGPKARAPVGTIARRLTPRLRACQLPKPIISEVLCLALFDCLQNQSGHEFGCVARRVIGGWASASRFPHPVLAEVGGCDERIDLTDNDAVFCEFRPS